MNSGNGRFGKSGRESIEAGDPDPVRFAVGVDQRHRRLPATPPAALVKVGADTSPPTIGASAIRAC
jgi:hypothetical protein